MSDERPGYKECPACAEWIREKAGLCRFCRALLTDAPLPRCATVEELQGALDAKTAPSAADLTLSIESQFADAGARVSRQQQQRLAEFLEQSSEEYRTASVLFVDVTGYTALSEKLRPEVIKQEILSPFYEICSQVVDFYNGMVVKHLGDACLAVFGAPVAYDRDAEAAVRALLAIRERIRQFPAIEGIEIRVSGGIETGEILTTVIQASGATKYDVFGPAVNLAQRLEAAAAPDTIRIGPATKAMVEDYFELKPLPPQRLKNVAQPVVACEVLRAKSRKRMRRDDLVRFVGREAEKRRMEEFWRRFIDERNNYAAGEAARPASPKTKENCSHGVLVTGDAGIGKTRLLWEFGQTRNESGPPLVGEGAPFGSKAPWGLWRSAIAALWGGGAFDPQQNTREALGEFLSQLGYASKEQLTFKALFGLEEGLDAFASLSPTAIKRQWTAEIRHLLERLSADRPLLILLDDLQWADRTSLDALQELSSNPPLRRVFFLLSCRPEFKIDQSPLRDFPRVRLRELDSADRQTLLDAVADAQGLRPEIREMISRRAGGSPSYLLELARAVAQIVQSEAAAPEAQLADRVARCIPATLTETIQSRLDRLEQPLRRVLQCAAILGHRVVYDFMRYFDGVREGLLDRLYSLVRLEFLEEAATPSGLEFRFRHNLTREVVYQSIIERQRRELHLTLGERLEDRHAKEPEAVCATLAFHFQQAGRHDRAVPNFFLAGQRAESQGAVEEAFDALGATLEQLSFLEPTKAWQTTRAQTLRAKGRLLRLTGKMDEAAATFHEGAAVARTLKTPGMRATLRAELGLTHLHSSRYEAAERELAAAQRLTQRVGDRNLLAMIANGRGICAWGRGRFKKARAFFQKIDRMRLGQANPVLAADAKNNLALIEWKTGNLKGALKQFKAAHALDGKAHYEFGVALKMMNIAIIEENLGRFAAAHEHYRESLEKAKRLQFAQLEAAVHGNLANLFLMQERYDDALRHGAQSFAIAERIHDRRSAAIALENTALAHLGLKQFSHARRVLRKAFKLARAIDDRERMFSLELVDIELLLAQRQGKRARPKLEAAEADLKKLSYTVERPRLLRLKAQWQWLVKQPGAAETLARALASAREQNNQAEIIRLRALQKQLKQSIPLAKYLKRETRPAPPRRK